MNRFAVFMSTFMMITFLLIAAGCQSENKTEDNDEQTIYTTIYPIQFITEQLVGSFTDVRTVFPPGVDAHTYEATTKDMIDMSSGAAFIYLGAGMESFAETIAEALASSDIELIEVGLHAELFMPSDEDHHEHGGHDHGDFDPHIWFDPLRMIDMAEIIKNELTTIFPAHTETIEENYVQLTEQLTDLDEQYTQLFATKTNKKMVVSHAAHGYWEERYGVEQIAISGISVTEEPSQRELAQLIEQATEELIEYIFFEQNTSNKIATIIQEHIDAEALYIHNLEVLMDEDIENGRDYLSIMKDNLEVLDQGIE